MKQENKQENDIKKIEYLEKMESYLKTKEEIFDFVISKKILIIFLFYFGVAAALLALGGNAYFEYKIKNEVNKEIANRVSDEVQYLEMRNKITILGDKAISKGAIDSYEELELIARTNNSEKIRYGATAEKKRVESLQSSWFEYYPINKLEHTTVDGKKIIGENIPTPILMDMLIESKEVGKSTTILEILYKRKEKNLPENLLKVGRETFHLQIRFKSLRYIQYLLNDFTANPFNYKEFEQWWYTSGKSEWDNTKNR